MHARRFDAAVRAAVGSRRAALAALAAAGLGGGTVTARRRRPCPPHRTCPDGCCAGGEVCLNRRCYKSCAAADDQCLVGACGACTCFVIAPGYGWGVCAAPATLCDAAPPCVDDGDCLAGELCLSHHCCSTVRKSCWRPCPA